MNDIIPEKLRYDRELSWLSFNYRVLQEAKDPINPLFERIRFLAIFSSNLDEFYRVRVASIKHILRMKEDESEGLDINYYEKLLKTINETVNCHQEEFGSIFREQIIPELNRNKIYLPDKHALTNEQYHFLEAVFRDELYPNLYPTWLNENQTLFITNRSLYFALKLREKTEKHGATRYAIINIPDKSGKKRFIELPGEAGSHHVVFVDDLVWLFVNQVYPGYEVEGCYAIKLSRDADLYLNDEMSGDLVEKIKSSLNKRQAGLPTRFLYDHTMPADMQEVLSKALGLAEDELNPGGRYHNFHDLFHFPFPDKPKLNFKPMPQLSHPALAGKNSAFEAIRKQDVALFFPYQGFDHVLNWLEEAVYDEQVKSIKITLYRVAKYSKVAEALIRAAKKGKQVTVFVEVKARMDELNNIEWLEEMRNCGVEILSPYDYWKVHSKLFVVERIENETSVFYAYLGTGNFNEKTTQFYCDVALLTADQRLTTEANKIFDYLRDLENQSFAPDHLLVAPANMRNRFTELMDREIQHAKAGSNASLFIKMNSLQDKQMIKKLHEASENGVKIRLLVRGVCCLKPGLKGSDRNIEIISIVDRFLEHSRVYIFENGGDEEVYLASADWMKRNLSRRVEVAFPVYSHQVHEQVKQMMELQWADNTKARIINNEQDNPYRQADNEQPVRAQYDFHKYLIAFDDQTSDFESNLKTS